GEHLSGTAAVRKGLLAELLQAYKSSNGTPPPPTDRRACLDLLQRLDAQESYYEEAQPYDSTINDEAEAVSSSYESYDDDEISTKKSTAQHQWPSTEASIELMRDARICAFLWRKKWLGQWAKQLCVIRENRLLCYKSSKEQTPLLDVSLMGCSVVYKEKQLKRKEHKLKIVPQGGETIVLSLQSREQAEQWLKVIQEISPKSADGSDVGDSPRLICTKGEISERYSMASESGSSTDSHAEILEKDVKKKYGAGLKLSNLMNIGKKKISSLDSPEKNMETSGYLNVLVKSQWRMRWCLIKNGQLWFYQDKGRSKQAQQPVQLEGCMVLPDPSPDHLYSFRIQMDGEELAILEAKSSADMGHWLGLLLSQTGTKTDPEDLTYDYVNSERISSIVNAAKTSMYLMQRRYSEPNAYIDNLPLDNQGSEDIYDDVASIENEQERGVTMERDGKERVHLDLMPVRSFLHTNAGMVSPQREPSPTTTPTDEHQHPGNEVRTHTAAKIQTSFCPFRLPSWCLCIGHNRVLLRIPSCAAGSGPTVVKLGKNRTEADVRRFTDERDRLEREREEVKNTLATLRKERREAKEDLKPSKQPSLEAYLKQKEEECREAEQRRVEVELSLVEVKESLKKVEAGPFTLGTTVDSGLLDSAPAAPAAPVAPVNNGDSSPVNSTTALKSRPLSIMAASKGNVLQKAKCTCIWKR
uniref:Actin filament-associated protein 1-like 2 n=1 Tax=Electrophorus electricus TaxID=8005 RepID=A0A4W4ELE1_ELEEL